MGGGGGVFLDDCSTKDFFREINTNTYTFYKLGGRRRRGRRRRGRRRTGRRRTGIEEEEDGEEEKDGEEDSPIN